MTRLLNFLFGPFETIDGNGRCDYLNRWFIFSNHFTNRFMKLYLHHFIGDDWSTDFHDHPKRFVSIGLWGSYIEETPYFCRDVKGEITHRQRFRAPWIRTFPAHYIHRLIVPKKNTWTLVIVFTWQREWGFWNRQTGEFIEWKTYMKSGRPDKVKACGD